MSMIATILRRSCRGTTIQSPTKASPDKCSYVGVPWRWFSFAERITKISTSMPNQTKAIDKRCPAISVATICKLHVSAHVNQCWLVMSKYRYNPSLGFSGVPSLRHMYSSDTRTELEAPENAISEVSPTGASDISTANDGWNIWIDMSENAHHSMIDASTAASKSAKDLNDAITLHAQELFGNHANLEKV